MDGWSKGIGTIANVCERMNRFVSESRDGSWLDEIGRLYAETPMDIIVEKKSKVVFETWMVVLSVPRKSTRSPTRSHPRDRMDSMAIRDKVAKKRTCVFETFAKERNTRRTTKGSNAFLCTLTQRFAFALQHPDLRICGSNLLFQRRCFGSYLHLFHLPFVIDGIRFIQSDLQCSLEQR